MSAHSTSLPSSVPSFLPRLVAEDSPHPHVHVHTPLSLLPSLLEPHPHAFVSCAALDPFIERLWRLRCCGANPI